MSYRQLRRRAASLSPKSRPKVHLPARSAPLLGEIRSPQRAQHAKRTVLLMTDASHRMDKPEPKSVALYLPPFSHTGSLPSARTPSSPQNSDSSPLSRRTFSFDNCLGPPAYLKVHTASYHFLGNGKIRSFGYSLLFSGVASGTHHGLSLIHI